MMDIDPDAETAIHTATVAAGGVALTPIPFADSVLLAPIQITMIAAIYKAYDKDIANGVLKGIVTTTFASSFGSSLAGELLKFIPGLGSVAGAALNTGVAVAITEGIGYTVAKSFESGESIDPVELGEIIKAAIKSALHQ
ncbi:YcjF family protein [Lactobacillus selangorensis]|nr:DUF697 domain-containing protein [Lactobacillus selangorensis]